jgi:DNA-binding HxlR family transcriptional regulator
MPSSHVRCGAEAIIDLVGGKWKLLILFHIGDGRRRFGDLRRLIENVSEKILSQRLKEMVADGLLRRIDFEVVPPRVEYELTEFGKGLTSAMHPLCEWGAQNAMRIATRSSPKGTESELEDRS